MVARIAPPASMLAHPPAGLISVHVGADRVFKLYHTAGDAEAARSKFDREANAYAFFAREAVAFVPPLLGKGRSDRAYWLALGNGGEPLTSWLERATDQQMPSIVLQIMQIDEWLFRNNVNYRFSSPSDILVDNNNNVKIIDFEYTSIGERYGEILLTALSHRRMDGVSNQMAKRQIRRLAALHQGRIYNYRTRRFLNAVMNRSGIQASKKYLNRIRGC